MVSLGCVPNHIEICDGLTVGETAQQFPRGTIGSGVGDPAVHRPPASQATSATQGGVFNPLRYAPAGRRSAATAPAEEAQHGAERRRPAEVTVSAARFLCEVVTRKRCQDKEEHEDVGLTIFPAVCPPSSKKHFAK
ncbi:hypothetical protein NDU88_006175 [Pleurodeles waltl]|uniref:Uncharacterized protein n=1 Tax=Pleurodeles waltl TaxID=8319 RepID=A0AAV7MF39_PLEWA|nr:hypothetical protein NDU88_006175 [Pleurodeles waltl]